MKEYNFLAFDIGATSGRAVLGTLKDAKFEMKEITQSVCFGSRIRWWNYTDGFIGISIIFILLL